MAFPYTIIMSLAGFVASYWILIPLAPLVEGDRVADHPQYPACFGATTTPAVLDAFLAS